MTCTVRRRVRPPGTAPAGCSAPYEPNNTALVIDVRRCPARLVRMVVSFDARARPDRRPSAKGAYMAISRRTLIRAAVAGSAVAAVGGSELITPAFAASPVGDVVGKITV